MINEGIQPTTTSFFARIFRLWNFSDGLRGSDSKEYFSFAYVIKRKLFALVGIRYCSKNLLSSCSQRST